MIQVENLEDPASLELESTPRLMHTIVNTPIAILRIQN